MAGTVLGLQGPWDSNSARQPAAANGIALDLQLKFRVYLVRGFTSWLIKGVYLAILALVEGVRCISNLNNPKYQLS